VLEAVRAEEQTAEPGELLGCAFPSRAEAPASEEKPEFLAAVPRLVLVSRLERQAPATLPWAVAPVGQRKASGAAAVAGFPAARTWNRKTREAVAAPLAETEVLVLAASSPAAPAVVAFLRPAEAAPALVAQ